MAHAVINEFILGELDKEQNNNNNNYYDAPNIVGPVAAVVVEELGNPLRVFNELFQQECNNTRPHNLGYFEIIISLYNMSEFKSHFRMS